MTQYTLWGTCLIPRIPTHTQQALERLMRVNLVETRMTGEILIQGTILAGWNDVGQVRDEIIDILDQAGLDFQEPDITLAASMSAPFEKMDPYISIWLNPAPDYELKWIPRQPH